MQNIDDATKTWGIVELMGHKVVAGMVSKSEMLGAALMRVDVPATSTYPEFTQFYGTSAIYCVTFVSEEVARRTAEANKTNPVSVYVPDLVTREQMDQKLKEYTDHIERLRALKGLPAGGVSCTWKGVGDVNGMLWNTSCNNIFEFDEGDPHDNGFKNCPYCGREIEVFDEDDGDTRGMHADEEDA